MKVQAIQGREERQRRREARRKRREERRERGDAWWQKLGAAAKKVAPPLVAARAAMLALVSANFNGLADKMARANPERARDKWEAMGGEWDKMEAAIRKGGGTVQGIGFVPLVLPTILSLNAGGAPVAPGAPAAKGGGLAALWKIATPILAPILKLLGIDLAPVAPTMRQMADDVAAAGGNADGFELEDRAQPSRSGGGANTALLLGGVVVAALLLSGKRK